MKYPWSNISGFPELDFGYLKFKLYWASTFKDGTKKIHASYLHSNNKVGSNSYPKEFHC